ncbi:MAG: leucine-rich repeat domain-containing protein [Bacillus sp. (in: firmicutes)]
MKHFQFKIALVAMLLSFAPKQASAYDFEVDGIYYNVVSMSDFTCEVTSGDNEYTGEVNIPEQVTYNKRTFSVTSIGYDAFIGCKGLTSVTIGNSVTSIGHYAFSLCSGLTGVTIGNSVTTIGDDAFSWCSDLTGVTIPNSVTSIGDHAFNECI